jgi:hypothetical protein
MLDEVEGGSIAMMSSSDLGGLSRKPVGKVFVDEERRVPEVMLEGRQGAKS